MIVACATDRRYVELAGVLINSIAMNGDVPKAKLVVCDYGLRQMDRDLISACAMGRDVAFVEIDEAARKRFSKYRRTVSWSRAIYSRLLLPDLIPEEAGRMIYLDSDMVVRSSLRPLFETPLNGCAVGAVLDAGDPAHIQRRNVRLGRPPNTPYLNSGALLIDLDKWREQEIGRKCLAYLDTGVKGYPDQDALNISLGERWVPIDRKWNFTESRCPDFPREHFESAVILHYTARKPNLAHCDHPARDIYLAQRAHTPWASKPLVSDFRRRLAREGTKVSVLVDKCMTRLRTRWLKLAGSS